jgi:Putative prokaryotic signal transducing protein
MGSPVATIATFATIAEAELARNVLTAEGIDAVLADAETVGMLWHVGGALGGIKLQVRSDEERRARSILARRTQLPDEPAVDDYGHKATALKAYRTLPEEEDDLLESPAEATARRAWRSAVIGLFLCPPLLSFYSVGLLLQLLWASDRLSDRGRLAVYGALVIDGLALVIGAVVWKYFLVLV